MSVGSAGALARMHLFDWDANVNAGNKLGKTALMRLSYFRCGTLGAQSQPISGGL